jgi:glycosyltransferase involved in cell wall biosynthesis
VNISVIIPTFNRADSLGRALDSVLNQSHAPQEIIVVDDGSTDATRELVTNHPAQPRYLYQANGGVSSSRNLGIRSASGEWLAFLDSDDEWLPGKLAAQIETLEQQPDCKICHTEEIWIRNGKRVNAMNKHAKSGGHIFQRCLPLCVISPSAAMIHRSLLDEVGLFDETLPACEDYDLWLRICARHPVAFVPEPQIVKYGGHADQLSRRHWGMDRFRIQALEKILQCGDLSLEDRSAAILTLTQKAEILANGAEKREKLEDAQKYRALQRKFQNPEVDT